MLIGFVFGFVSSVVFGGNKAFFSEAITSSFSLITSSFFCCVEFVTKLSAGISISSFTDLVFLVVGFSVSATIGGIIVEVVDAVLMALLSGWIMVVFA